MIDDDEKVVSNTYMNSIQAEMDLIYLSRECYEQTLMKESETKVTWVEQEANEKSKFRNVYKSILKGS